MEQIIGWAFRIYVGCGIAGGAIYIFNLLRKHLSENESVRGDRVYLKNEDYVNCSGCGCVVHKRVGLKVEILYPGGMLGRTNWYCDKCKVPYKTMEFTKSGVRYYRECEVDKNGKVKKA